MVSLRQAVSQYFEDSTVHGFRYVATGRTTFVRTFWTLVIIGKEKNHGKSGVSFEIRAFLLAGALSSAVILSLQSLRERQEFPVQTYVEAASVSEVPFPAITVNAHDFLDHWSMLRFDIVTLSQNCSEVYTVKFTVGRHWIWSSFIALSPSSVQSKKIVLIQCQLEHISNRS